MTRWVSPHSINDGRVARTSPPAVPEREGRDTRRTRPTPRERHAGSAQLCLTRLIGRRQARTPDATTTRPQKAKEIAPPRLNDHRPLARRPLSIQADCGRRARGAHRLAGQATLAFDEAAVQLPLGHRRQGCSLCSHPRRLLGGFDVHRSLPAERENQPAIGGEGVGGSVFARL